MGIEFRRATGDINSGNSGLRQPVKYSVHRLARHDFAAPRPGVDVAVRARLVAFFADVDLKYLRRLMVQREAVLLKSAREAVSYNG